MWDIISACPFLHRNLTLNLERWVQPLLTSQDYKKLLLTVSRSVSRAASPCPAPACVSVCAHTVSRSVSRAASPCPASQCAPGRILGKKSGASDGSSTHDVAGWQDHAPVEWWPGDCATGDRALLLCSPPPRRTGLTSNETFCQECFFRL